MKKHEVPPQILILTNPEKDPTGEFLERNFLEIVVSCFQMCPHHLDKFTSSQSHHTV
jgi:hypothetical protein